jgi:hypothetical protein
LQPPTSDGSLHSLNLSTPGLAIEQKRLLQCMSREIDPLRQLPRVRNRCEASMGSKGIDAIDGVDGPDGLIGAADRPWRRTRKQRDVR